MGRAKIAMEFITKEKARNTTYIKRKKGLIKKAHEFSVLCGVPICIVIYPYNEGKVPLNPEVYSFKPTEGSNHLDLARARDPSMAREIIDRYLDVSKEEKKKRAINLCDMFDAWNKRAGQELSKLRHRNVGLKYPTNVDSTMLISGFNANQLVELIAHLDQKLEILRQRVDMIKGNQGRLIPIFEPTPVSNSVILTNYNNTHLADQGDADVKLMDGFSLFNYPAFGNHHQACHHLGLIDPNGLHDRATSLGVGHGEGHICYDQSAEIVDNMVASSSNVVAGLPMSVPLHITLPPNIAFSWHGMHATQGQFYEGI